MGAAGALQEDSLEGFAEVVWVTEDHSVDFMPAASLTAAVSRMVVASGGIDESRYSTEAIIQHLPFRRFRRFGW